MKAAMRLYRKMEDDLFPNLRDLTYQWQNLTKDANRLDYHSSKYPSNRYDRAVFEVVHTLLLKQWNWGPRNRGDSH